MASLTGPQLAARLPVGRAGGAGLDGSAQRPLMCACALLGADFVAALAAACGALLLERILRPGAASTVIVAVRLQEHDRQCWTLPCCLVRF